MPAQWITLTTSILVKKYLFLFKKDYTINENQRFAPKQYEVLEQTDGDISTIFNERKMNTLKPTLNHVQLNK